MKQVLNLDDPAGKTVGRRTAPRYSFQYGLGLQKTLVALYGRIPIPKGVHRFHSHEEADAWLMKHLARRKANQSSFTSSGEVVS